MSIAPSQQDLLASIKTSQRNEPDSGILIAVNHGMSKPDVIPLWTGEGHLPTPDFICEAANAALHRGETFYTWQRGIPPLRNALAAYHNRLYNRPFEAENFYVTGGGMQAMQTIFQLLCGESDEIIIPSPAWPNYPGPLRMMGAKPVAVPLDFTDCKWSLDLERLFATVTPRTKAICLNSPSNPIGWVATQQDLRAILDFTRKHGLWIIADEVYGRFYYGNETGVCAPSFLDICDTEERVIFANTFSKNWAMTGWRIGWVQAAKALGPAIERIIQYNTSGTAQFMQRAAITALENGEEFVAQQVATARKNRDFVAAQLKPFPAISYDMPQGAFYFFFRLEGMKNSTATVIKIIDEAKVGFSPGGTFGPGGDSFLRMCFLRDQGKLAQAMDRFTNWLNNSHAV